MVGIGEVVTGAKVAVKGVELAKQFPFHPWRRLRATIRRWPRSFRIPAGPTLILVPIRQTTDGTEARSNNDVKASEELGDLLTGLGFVKGKDWRCLDVMEPLLDVDRKKNLVILCGSNPMLTEVYNAFPDLLKEVSYLPGFRREDRAFLWKSHRYNGDSATDFALVAVRKNPYYPKRKIILLMGLRGVGTLGASKFFADDDHIGERREAHDLFHLGSGEIEFLLKITHRNERDIESIKVAEKRDGQFSGAPSTAKEHTNGPAALSSLYLSLRQDPQHFTVQDFVYDVIYAADFSVVFRQELTLSSDEQDILMFPRRLMCDVDLYDPRKLDLQAEVIEGEGSALAVLADDSIRHKRFLLIPIPRIKKGEASRRFGFQVTWPGAGWKLRTEEQVDRVTVRVPESKGPLDKITIRLRIDVSNAKFAVWREDSLTPAQICTAGRPFIFTETNVTTGTEYHLNVQRVKT